MSKDPKPAAVPVRVSAPIIDVAHPGKSVPADTSKSIITPRTILKDPMVVPAGEKPQDAAPPEPAESASTTEPASVPISKIRLKPGDDMVAEAPSEPPAVADSASPAEETEAAEATPADKQLASEASQQKEAKAASERAEYEAKLQAVYESKQYFLPINAVEQRRTARFIALGIILSAVLILVWLDIALDANLIHLSGLKPVTHFFSN